MGLTEVLCCAVAGKSYALYHPAGLDALREAAASTNRGAHASPAIRSELRQQMRERLAGVDVTMEHLRGRALRAGVWEEEVQAAADGWTVRKGAIALSGCVTLDAFCCAIVSLAAVLPPVSPMLCIDSSTDSAAAADSGGCLWMSMCCRGLTCVHDESAGAGHGRTARWA